MTQRHEIPQGARRARWLIARPLPLRRRRSHRTSLAFGWRPRWARSLRRTGGPVAAGSLSSQTPLEARPRLGRSSETSPPTWKPGAPPEAGFARAVPLFVPSGGRRHVQRLASPGEVLLLRFSPCAHPAAKSFSLRRGAVYQVGGEVSVEQSEAEAYPSRDLALEPKRQPPTSVHPHPR